MRTVKQVSDLTGISVRALHYYDDEALKTLQQILFLKSLIYL
ncbi:DNA-binding transcriptional MerR regulator [Clostridium beijerinckii]|uniref:DNA-binding transcriptional MerR regulator n=1 Tax=Clostridium beijerinckii TaxID=1520 RepID=A0AAX0AWH5_CLOBE|nr:DNA-binding transcriptional MerR regulator [Clostridium beijerinckii]NYC71901.1 DNA-binding transcriptional MerR regulator [Clostridium beijerinckii]